MGTIGGLITRPGEGREKVLVDAMSRSHRGRGPEVVARGSALLGAAGGEFDDADTGAGTEWTVAVSGVVSAVGDIIRPSHPADEIARAFDRSGVQAASHVVGEFTCIATDGSRLIAFRDHLGTDGLFIGSKGSVTAVMSEPKQVVAALGIDRRPDMDALVSGYFSQWDDEVPCVVQGVERVPRGFVIEATDTGWRRVGRLWDPEAIIETARLSVAEARERAWQLIVAAVDRSVDGPTAVTLSGGIDSTLIAIALARQPREERIGALSAVYPESPSVDESTYISETASMLGLSSDTYHSTKGRLSNLETWVDRCDGPMHGLALGAFEDMNEQASVAGYRTLLSGELAEHVYDLREHAIGRMLTRGRLATAARNVTQLKRRGMPWSSLLRVVGATLTPSRIALAYTHRRPAEALAPWLDRSYMPGLDRRWDLERRPSKRWPDIQLYFATGPSSPGLEVSTIMGEYGGVRTRRPLADRDLWEFFLSLPPETKFPDAWTKSLIRQVMDGRAPDSVVWRQDKTVFDEDAKRKAGSRELIQRVSNGFELPGVRYGDLIRRLQEGEMTAVELSLARNLASIHTFVEITS